MSEEVVDPPSASTPSEDWSQRAAELLGEAEAATSVEDRVALLCRVAEIYERKLGDPSGALLTLQAALEQEPASGRVVKDMERIARGNGIWSLAIGVTTEVASALPDPKQAADLWVQIGFWSESGLAKLDDAINAAREALELDPSHGGALTLLEDLYRRQRNWDRYLEILIRKRDAAGSDPYRLIDAYREVLRYEPQHPGALDGLAHLLEATGDWGPAAEALRQLIAALPRGEAGEALRLSARQRLGALLKERLGDERGAEEQLVLTLATPGGEAHVPSLLQLAEIYGARRDWLKARQLIGRAAAAVSDPYERVGLLVEAAAICADQLDDQAQAAELYAEILAADPLRMDVVDRLATIRFKRGDWAGLLPLADQLVAALADEVSPADRARLYHQLGRARAETGDAAGALEAQRAAAASGADGESGLPARREVAALAFATEAWGEAAGAYEGLVAGQAASLRRDDALEAFERLGIALRRAGQPARAVGALEKAVAFDPRRRRALEELVASAKEAGDDDAVVRHTQGLLAVTDDRATKRDLLETVATIHRERRHDPQRAIAAYRAALEIWPDERSIMHRMLELLTETKQWKASVQVLARLADLAEPGERNPYYVAAGNILADELKQPADAIDAYEQALDADPNDFKSFERIDTLVTATRDWKTQARSYRRQIKRMGNDVAPEQRAALLTLWQGVGEIYRTRLKDYAAASAAFEVAVGMDPESIERRRILAELYRLQGPSGYAKAIGEHRTIVSRAATTVAMTPDLKIMLRLFIELGALDEAYGVAAVLVLLGQADADERLWYDRYRPKGVVRAHGRLTEDLWQRLVYHPDQDRPLSQLLATLCPALALAHAKAPKDVRLKKKQQRDVTSDPSVACKAFAYGCAVFGMPAPEVYLAPEAAAPVEVVDLKGAVPGQPALVIGRPLMETPSDIELAFTVGQTLAAIRPEHLVLVPAFMSTPAELEVAVRGAVKLIDSERPIPTKIGSEVEKYAAFLHKAMPPQLREQLSMLVRKFGAAQADASGGLDLARWSRAASLTTLRAGLLLSGDLEVALRLGERVAAAAGIDTFDLTRELCAWSVSDGYFELRAALGLHTVALG